MPRSRRPLSPSEASSKSTQARPASVLPHAPKLPILAPKPSSPKASTPPSTTGPGVSRKPTKCAVCLQPACQLSTHRAFGTSLQPTGSLSMNRLKVSSLPKDRAFESSYAYHLGQQYVSRDIAASKVDPFYDLPVKANFNTPEMHRLFHDWFTIEAQSSFRIPRPPQMAGDLLCSPFLMPALQDTALCLSILAMAAATVPARAGKSSKNIISLTLVGEAMQQMRERLHSDPENIADVTIVAATFLWAVNAWLKDTNAMQSHGKSVYAFVESRGGMSELGMVGAVAQIIRWVDIMHALIFSTPCQFLDTVDPTPVFQSTPCQYGTVWILPRTFKTATISADVVTACQQTCALIALLELVEAGSVTAMNYVYLINKLCFLHTGESLLRSRYRNTGTLDACICFALSLIKIRSFYGVSHPRLMITVNAERLVKAIKATGGLSFWQNDLDMLIWLLFVAVMLPEDFEDKQWCAELLCQAVTIKYDEDEDWPPSWREDIKRCLISFVWSELRFADVFNETCDAIARAQGFDVEKEGDDDAIDKERGDVMVVMTDDRKKSKGIASKKGKGM